MLVRAVLLQTFLSPSKIEAFHLRDRVSSRFTDASGVLANVACDLEVLVKGSVCRSICS